MKKLILLLLILFMISPKSACQTSTFRYEGNRNTIVQTVDTIKSTDVTRINNSLTAFYKANRNSQVMIFGGAAVAIIGTLLFHKDSNKINPFILLGGASEFAGCVVYLDSFKYLNLNKKKTVKMRNKSFDDVYFY